MKAYNRLTAIFEDLYTINSINSILDWDASVIMPANSSSIRSNQLSYLTKSSYKKLFNNRVKDYINEVDVHELNDLQKANFRLMKRQYDDFAATDCKIMQKFVLATNKCEIIWRDARKNNDFKILQQPLTEVVELIRLISQSRSDYFKVDPYQSMIDKYEYGISLKTIDTIFAELKSFILPIVDKIIANQPSISQSNIKFSIPKQEQLCKQIMSTFGFDFSRGRLDISTHPFCGGLKGDIRITTRYDEYNIISGLDAVIHETGHAMYEHNLPSEVRAQPVSQYMGMAIHESQSLFAEVQLGKSKEFISYLYPLILKEFNLNEHEFSLERFNHQSRKVEKSFIRVEADEVTYPLHVIMRYELEKKIICGDLEVKDLPYAWNESFKEMFGIVPPSNTLGVMQDIHWMCGIFGYFPLYSIGAVIAAQIKSKIKSDLPTFKDDLAKGDLSSISNWLKVNIHEKGSRYDFQTLIKQVTGEDLNAKAFINHIKDRYL